MRPALDRLASLAVWIAPALLVGWWTAAAHVRAQHLEPELTVSVRGEPAQPGSVLAVTVTTSVDAHGVSADAFGQRALFVRGDSARVWHGLVGVDLSVSESSSLAVNADFGDGRQLASTRPLVLAPRQFRTRRLRVAGQFVDPSPPELARIRAEAERLEAIFGTVTLPDRLATFVRPVPGATSATFGSRSIFNGEARAPHAGEDFRGAVGTAVAAPGAGRVVLAEDLFFTGQTVVIDHGLGLYSLLAHLSRIDAVPGQAVARGDVVGLLGATGRVTGPHLHWTVRLAGARVDPLRVVALLAPGTAFLK
jgi:murein DD-endopeptidase MepM/ murein hydrolase activator NlpD